MNETGLYFFIEGFAVAFFVIIAIINLSHRDIRLRKILGCILMYWCIEHIMFLVMTLTEDFLIRTRLYSNLLNAIDMTAEPTCCFLIMELCRPGWLNVRRIIVNELPFVGLLLCYVLTANELYYNILLILFFAYGIYIFVMGLYYIPKYNKFLHEHYSYEKNINLRWVYIVLVSFFVLMVIYFITAHYNSYLADLVYIIGSLAVWSWICYCIERQNSILNELLIYYNEQLQRDKQKKEDDFNATISELIEKKFVEKQLFLNPTLSLADMAQAIGTNRTYLSKYLNETQHTSFYDYINSLRISYAEELLKNSQYSITAISAISGFNSYSTFRRVFIAKHGIAPQEYKNTISIRNID